MKNRIEENKEENGSIEINLNDFDKSTLVYLFMYAHEHNLTFNKTIENLLENFLEAYAGRE